MDKILQLQIKLNYTVRFVFEICFSLLFVDKRVLKISNLKKSVDVVIKIRRDTQKHVLKTTSNSEQVKFIWRLC